MPRDPQGAETRTETTVEWRNVYRDFHGDEQVQPVGFPTRELLDEFTDTTGRIAIERIETRTTITRYPIPPLAGEETKG